MTRSRAWYDLLRTGVAFAGTCLRIACGSGGRCAPRGWRLARARAPVWAQEGDWLPIKVSVKDGEPLDKVLKRFKRICDKEGIRKAVRHYSHYEKPSDKRRRKAKERIRRLRKQIKKKAKAVERARKGGPA